MISSKIIFSLNVGYLVQVISILVIQYEDSDDGNSENDGDDCDADDGNLDIYDGDAADDNFDYLAVTSFLQPVFMCT